MAFQCIKVKETQAWTGYLKSLIPQTTLHQEPSFINSWDYHLDKGIVFVNFCQAWHYGATVINATYSFTLLTLPTGSVNVSEVIPDGQTETHNWNLYCGQMNQYFEPNIQVVQQQAQSASMGLYHCPWQRSFTLLCLLWWHHLFRHFQPTYGVWVSCTFQQHNGKPHFVHITEAWLARKRAFNWTASSPDMLPMEDVWRISKQILLCTFAKT